MTSQIASFVALFILLFLTHVQTERLKKQFAVQERSLSAKAAAVEALLEIMLTSEKEMARKIRLLDDVITSVDRFSKTF